MGTSIKKYFWMATLVLVTVISYLSAKMATLYIESLFPAVVLSAGQTKKASMDKSTAQFEKNDIQAILARNFFDPNESSFEDDEAPTEEVVKKPTEVSEKEAPLITSDEAVKTNLPIKLIATVSVGDGQNPYSSAVIESGRKAEVYTSKSPVMFATGVKIVRILAKRVEFTNKGRLEFVELEDFVKMKKMGRRDRARTDIAKKVQRTRESKVTEVVQDGDVYQIPRAEIDKALGNINKLYTQIRAVPNFKEGRANGFKLLSVKRGSIFDKLGLRRGDILKTINGTTLDIQSGLQTFNKLKNEAKFELEIERRGEERALKYEII